VPVRGGVYTRASALEAVTSLSDVCGPLERHFGHSAPDRVAGDPAAGGASPAGLQGRVGQGRWVSGVGWGGEGTLCHLLCPSPAEGIFNPSVPPEECVRLPTVVQLGAAGWDWERGRAAPWCLLVERFPDLLKVSLASIFSISNTRKNASSLTAVKLP